MGEKRNLNSNLGAASNYETSFKFPGLESNEQIRYFYLFLDGSYYISNIYQIYNFIVYNTISIHCIPPYTLESYSNT